MNKIENIRIEKVGDIHSDYPYLEIFLKGEGSPFLEASISSDKTLCFKIYSSNKDILLKSNELKYILSVAQEFLLPALKNEDDLLNLIDCKSIDDSN